MLFVWPKDEETYLILLGKDAICVTKILICMLKFETSAIQLIITAYCCINACPLRPFFPWLSRVIIRIICFCICYTKTEKKEPEHYGNSDLEEKYAFKEQQRKEASSAVNPASEGHVFGGSDVLCMWSTPQSLKVD